MPDINISNKRKSNKTTRTKNDDVFMLPRTRRIHEGIDVPT